MSANETKNEVKVAMNKRAKADAPAPTGGTAAGPAEAFSCSFDRVFQDASQEAVFREVRARVLPVTKGINCTVFAYGQTGTGTAAWCARG